MKLWDIVREVVGSPSVPLEEQCRDADIVEEGERTTFVECEARGVWEATASHVDEPSVTLTWLLCQTHLAEASANPVVLLHTVRWVGGDPS